MPMKFQLFPQNQTLPLALWWVCPAFLLVAGGCTGKPPPSQSKAAIPRELPAALSAWAQKNGGAFPNEPGDANANFRLLFKAGLLTSEDGFGTPGDGWCGEGNPDGDLGSAPDFAKALEPGELSIIYVAGLDGSSNSQSILLIAGIGPVHAGITPSDTTSPAVDAPERVALVAVNGSAKVWSPHERDKTRRRAGGNWLAWLVEDFGIDPRNLRFPALPRKK